MGRGLGARGVILARDEQLDSLESWGLGRTCVPLGIALAVLCLDFIPCVGGRSLCPAWSTRSPAFPFQHDIYILHQQQQQTSVCVSFFSPPAAACPPKPSGPIPAEMLWIGSSPLCWLLCAAAAA